MAHVETEPLSTDKGKIQGQAANEEENDCKLTAPGAEAVTNSDEARTQAESVHKDPTESLNTEVPNNSEAPQDHPPAVDQETPQDHPPAVDQETLQDHPPAVDQDKGDCAVKETPKEDPTKTLCERDLGKENDFADGSSVQPPGECGDGKTVDSETTAEEPAGDAEEKLSPEEPMSEELGPDKNVETIGPTPQVETAPVSDVPVTGKDSTGRIFWIGVILVAVIAALSHQLLQRDASSQKNDVQPIDIFLQEMEKVKLQFPSQREELWKRSRIHLQRHFLITEPTEPVSIILTAGVRAEGTLRCLAHSVALALSSALNASALHLEGSGKSGQDSDLVKSDIDSQLQKAFEGGKPIAVIHRFEELPPASTLIFYRYCDHENAAFKKTFLIFTVLLEEEQEIQAKIRLSEVEEMVTDHLQKKFLSHDQPSAFDTMDIDKYGGLWSRISHLILPVSTEQRIEKNRQC